MEEQAIPDWGTYPEEAWEPVAGSDVGVDTAGLTSYLDSLDVRGASWEGEVHGDREWGVVLTRGGYLLRSWGNPDYKFQTASLGKAFTWTLFGLAVDDGLVSPEDLVLETWTGHGELSHPHKYLDQGHHRNLRWRHLLGARDLYGHDAGFPPVTNGYFWRKGSSAQMQTQADLGIPEWARWTGDPFFDNYAHAEPGTVRTYSSGGMWRLSQALTHLWHADLKDVLDQRVFGRIGVPADRWDWVPGRTVFESKDWYAHMPGYGDYIDPPYELGGHVVRGGPGWVVMSASDLARFGHLVATGGVWRGERLISPEWIRGHSGGNGSLVDGESAHFTAIGRVTAVGIDFPLPAAILGLDAELDRP